MLEDNKNETPSELSEIGEFALIEKLTENIKLKNANTIKGVGDDAAVIDCGKNYMLVSTDSLIEGIHFNFMYCPLQHLGYKAVAVNLSDIYAMNGKPTQIAVSLALSNRMSLEALEEIYKGIYKACELYGVDLVGGDTTSSLSGTMISITAIGSVDKDKITYRSGAKENDLICVSGDLGGAYMGLQLLEREKKIFEENSKIQPDLSGYDYILERQLKPEPRRDVIEYLAENKIRPTAMIDISDGLSSELLHICKNSAAGCAVYEDKIPLDASTCAAAEEFNMNPVTCALNGGEDYELLFTINMKDYEKVKKNEYFTVVGHITDKNAGSNLITNSNQSIPLKAQGWKSF